MGEVDECGVCNGMNECVTVGSYSATARRRQLLSLDSDVATALNYLGSAAGNVATNVDASGTVTFVVNPLSAAQAAELAALYIVPAQSTARTTYALQRATTLGSITVGEVSKPPVCGDGICASGETPSMLTAATAVTCAADCPYSIGYCPSPGSSGVGDATLVRRAGV